MLFLRPGDGITMNRDRLLADAKARALKLAENYKPPEPPTSCCPARPARSRSTWRSMLSSNSARRPSTTRSSSGALAEVLSGGETDLTETLTEDRMLELERDGFMRLDAQPRHPGPDRAHARNRQAAAQLNPAQRRMLHASYKAPLRDMRFVLFELHGGDDLTSLPGFEDFSRDTDRRRARRSRQDLRGSAAAAQPLRRRGRLRTSRTAWCARRKASRKPTTRSARAAGPRSPAIPTTAARACRRRSTRWSRR